jgi:hypothetical protein
MPIQLNPWIESVAFPPIAEIRGWSEGRSFPPSKPLIDLTQAVPDYPPPPELIADLAGRMTDPQTALYTDLEGINPLRRALARHHCAMYAADLDAGDFIITAGASQAFWLALLAVCRPDDEVVVPVPYYFDHIMAMQALGITPVLVPIGEGHAGIPDATNIAALLGPRTRAILLVTPNNPTGAVIPSTVIDEIAELSHRHNIALIVDETYADLLPGGSAPHSLFRRPDWGELLIHIYSFSKVFGMTGYRVGALAAGKRVREAALKLHDTMMICAPHPAQLAALYGLEHLGDWAAANRTEISLRQSTFADALAVGGSPFRLEVAGGYFAWLRHPYPDRSDFDVAHALFDEQHLLTLPGTVFGPGQEAYLRLAVANVDATDLEEVAARLAAPGVGSR